MGAASLQARVSDAHRHTVTVQSKYCSSYDLFPLEGVLRIPLMGWALRALGSVGVDRRSGSSRKRALQQLEEWGQGFVEQVPPYPNRMISQPLMFESVGNTLCIARNAERSCGIWRQLLPHQATASARLCGGLHDLPHVPHTLQSGRIHRRASRAASVRELSQPLL